MLMLHYRLSTIWVSPYSIVLKVTFDGTNYDDWICNIKMALLFDGKEYVLKKNLVEIDKATATLEQLAS